MRFNCNFQHRKTGQFKIVPVTLTAEQVKSVQAIRARGDDAELFAFAYALQHAYRAVPDGFLHTEPPTMVHLS